jgi:hypothetical protein
MLQESVEFGLVAQGQADGEGQALGRGNAVQGLQEGNGGGHVAWEDGGEAMKGEGAEESAAEGEAAEGREQRLKIENWKPESGRAGGQKWIHKEFK